MASVEDRAAQKTRDDEVDIAIRAVHWQELFANGGSETVRDARTLTAWKMVMDAAEKAAQEWAACEKERLRGREMVECQEEVVRAAAKRLKGYLTRIDQVVLGLLSNENTGSGALASSDEALAEPCAQLVMSICVRLMQLDVQFLSLGVDNFEVHSKAWKYCIAMCAKYNTWAAPWLKVEPMLVVAERYAEDSIATLEIVLDALECGRSLPTPKARDLTTSAKFIKNNVNRIGMMLKLGRKIAEQSPPTWAATTHEALKADSPRVAMLFTSLERCCSRLQELLLRKETSGELSIKESLTALKPCGAKLGDAVAAASIFDPALLNTPLACAVLRELDVNDNFRTATTLWQKFARKIQDTAPVVASRVQITLVDVSLSSLLAATGTYVMNFDELGGTGAVAEAALNAATDGMLAFFQWTSINAGILEHFLSKCLDIEQVPIGTRAFVTAAFAAALERILDPSVAWLVGVALAKQSWSCYQQAALSNLSADLESQSKQPQARPRPWLSNLQPYLAPNSRVYEELIAFLGLNSELLKRCWSCDRAVMEKLSKSRTGLLWNVQLFGAAAMLEQLPLLPKSQDPVVVFSIATEGDFEILIKVLHSASTVKNGSMQAVLAAHTLTSIAHATSYFASSLVQVEPIGTVGRLVTNLTAALEALLTDISVTHIGEQRARMSARIALAYALSHPAILASLTVQRAVTVMRALTLSLSSVESVPEVFSNVAAIVPRLKDLNPAVANDPAVLAALGPLCVGLFEVANELKVGDLLAMNAFEQLARAFPVRDKAILSELLPSSSRNKFHSFLKLSKLTNAASLKDDLKALGPLKVHTVVNSAAPSPCVCSDNVLSKLDAEIAHLRSTPNRFLKSDENTSTNSSVSFKRSWASLQALLRGPPPHGENREHVLEKIRSLSAELIATGSLPQ